MFVAIAIMFGCGHSSPRATADRCVAGRSVACACTDGRDGAQVCRADGTFGPCECTMTAARNPDVTCQMVANHIFDMGMRDADVKIEAMPDGQEKELARKMWNEMHTSGREKMTAEFVKECLVKAYSLECLECIYGAQTEEEFEQRCEVICTP
jgi:hypothetical protein